MTMSTHTHGFLYVHDIKLKDTRATPLSRFNGLSTVITFNFYERTCDAKRDACKCHSTAARARETLIIFLHVRARPSRPLPRKPLEKRRYRRFPPRIVVSVLFFFFFHYFSRQSRSELINCSRDRMVWYIYSTGYTQKIWKKKRWIIKRARP